MNPFTIIRSCWLLFAAVWLLTAFVNKRSVFRESPLQRLRYSLALAGGAWLLFRGYKLGYPFNHRLIPLTDVTAWSSAALAVAGVLFCLWARATLGRNWSGTVTLKENHELIVRGPYRLVRHPIYTGLLAMFLGTACVIGNVAAFAGLILVFVSLWIKLTIEEAVMLRQFPEQYDAYRRNVKRIVPFVL